jgi:hypothetical protein
VRKTGQVLLVPPKVPPVYRQAVPGAVLGTYFLEKIEQVPKYKRTISITK